MSSSLDQHNGPEVPPVSRRPQVAGVSVVERRAPQRGHTWHHRGYIQGLRAVAVLSVMAAHAGLPIPGGFTGVDMFFVISGFVIALGLCRELLQTGGISLASFYGRRVRRLAPALAVMIVATCVLSVVLLSPFGIQQVTAKSALAAMFGVANLVIADLSSGYFGPKAQFNPFLHTWSLSVEEQFYVVFPITVVLCAWAWRSVRKQQATLGTVAVAAGLLAVLSLVLGWLPALSGGTKLHLGPYSLAGYYGPVPRLVEFSAGVLLAVWVVSKMQAQVRASQQLEMSVASQSWVRRAVVWGAACGGVLGLVASLVMVSESSAFPVPWAGLPVVSVMLIIWAVEQGSTRLAACLAWRPVQTVGDMSYSLYLWHWPCVVFGRQISDAAWVPVVATIVSVGPAWVSYRFVERRFVRRVVSVQQDSQRRRLGRGHTEVGTPSSGQTVGQAAVVVSDVAGPVEVHAAAPGGQLNGTGQLKRSGQLNGTSQLTGTGQRVVLAWLRGIAFGWTTPQRSQSIERQAAAVRVRQAVTLMVACCCAVGVAAVGLGVGAKLSWGSVDVAQDYRELRSSHAMKTRGCHIEPTVAQLAAGECTWNAHLPRQAYLVGDSHADHISDALISQASVAGFSVTGASGLACPVARPEGFYDPGMSLARNAGCADFVQRTLAWVEQQSPGVVFLASADMYWTNGERRMRAGQAMRAAAPELVERYRTALDAVVAQLAGAGHEVVLVQTVPSYWYRPFYFDAKACSAFEAVTESCAPQMPLVDYERSHGHVRSVVTQVAGDRGAAVVDPVLVLCPGAVCSPQVDGTFVYRDTNHLTVFGSTLLEPLLADVLRRVS